MGMNMPEVRAGSGLTTQNPNLTRGGGDSGFEVRAYYFSGLEVGGIPWEYFTGHGY
jgi:hypothetical protein